MFIEREREGEGQRKRENERETERDRERERMRERKGGHNIVIITNIAMRFNLQVSNSAAKSSKGLDG